MDKDVEALRNRLNGVQGRAALQTAADAYFYGWIESYPFWCWVKRFEAHGQIDGVYRMLKFSRQYGLDLVGLDPMLYQGKLDSEFYDQKTARVFHINDDHVRRNLRWDPTRDPREYIVEEEFTSRLDGRKYIFIGEKWAFAVGEDLFVAGRGHGLNADNREDMEFAQNLRRKLGDAVQS